MTGGMQVDIYIGLDIGTSGVRAVAYTAEGKQHAEGRAGLETSYGQEGQAEQRPHQWLEASATALRLLSEQLEIEAVVRAIGLTGQCPTFALLGPDGHWSERGYIYQDNRATKESERLISQFGAAQLHRRTGEAPSPFYVLPKLMWLQQHQPELLSAGHAVMQPRDAVGWYLTDQMATDPTHAACTLAYDIEQQDWAWDLLEQLGLHELHWPKVLPSCELLGKLTEKAASAAGLPAGIPVIIGAADSLCAVYGAQADGQGVVCDVSGTSTCLHLIINKPASDYAVNTYPAVDDAGWIAETGINTTGAALNWISGLFGRSHSDLLAEAALIPAGSEGLLFTPHLAGGERDHPGRPGAFIGLHMDHTPAHLIRAVLEGVALALHQRIKLLEQTGQQVREVVVSGGGARSELWNQIKADVFGYPLYALHEADSTALGAAMTAYQHINGRRMSVAGERTAYMADPIRHQFYQTLFDRFCTLEERLKGD